MRKLYSLLIFAITLTANAQTPKQNFTKAEEFYKNGNFTEAVAQTERVKKSLGKSNPKVEALLFLGYYNTQDYTKAKIAYETLKLMVPDNVKNSDAFKLYKSTGEQLDIKLAEIQTAFLKKQNQGSKSLYSYSQYEDRNANKVRRIRKLKEAFDDRMEKIQENNENEAIQVLEQILTNPTKEKFENYLLEERYESQFEEVNKYLRFWGNRFFSLVDWDSQDEGKKVKYDNLYYHLNLFILNLSGTKITYLPETIFLRGTLTDISILGTSVRSIPENITNCSALVTIRIVKNTELAEMINDFSIFTNLDYIAYSSNGLSKLPKVNNLNKLKYLFFNQFSRTIPSEIFDLTNLRTLGIMSVKPDGGFEFPDELGNLTNLESLDLRHCYVTKLPKSIEKLTKLKTLNLYNTRIEELPSELRNLKNLKIIYIGGVTYKPYSQRKVERDIKRLVKALPNLEVKYD